MLLRSPQCFQAPALLRYWHLASFDAPTVAVVWSLAFAWVAGIHLVRWVLMLQILVVWTVYVGDRLLDARSGLQRAGTGMRERHWFHWRHRRMLVPIAVLATLAGLAIAFHWMPSAIWRRDSLVGAASLAYFAHVHGVGRKARAFPKELLVGFLFTAGCALPSCSWSLTLPVTFFAVLAWLNCWAIEQWETSTLNSAVSRIALTIAASGLFASLCFLAYSARSSSLLLAGAASAALLALLDRFRTQMTAVTVRTFADIALLTPILLVLRG
jgi:hypothetical protein